jgi:hypothetical protein
MLSWGEIGQVFRQQLITLSSPGVVAVAEVLLLIMAVLAAAVQGVTGQAPIQRLL